MDTRMDRRSFLKNAALAGAALVVAPVALGAVEPQAALADETCTANVSCNPDNALIDTMIGSDGRGYMTNANTPLHGGFPTSPVSGNATYTVDADGNYVITIPLVNTMFRLLDIAGTDDSNTIQIAQGEKDTSSKPNRITSITVTSPVSSGAFTVTNVSEYAGYALIKDYANWPVLIEFSI